MSPKKKDIIHYSKAIQKDPENLHALSKRGNLYYDSKEYDKALEDYNKIIEIITSPGESRIKEKAIIILSDAILRKSNIMVMPKGDFQEAIKGYTKILSYYNQGIKLSQENSKEEKLKDFKNRKNTALKNRSFAYFNLGTEELNKVNSSGNHSNSEKKAIYHQNAIVCFSNAIDGFIEAMKNNPNPEIKPILKETIKITLNSIEGLLNKQINRGDKKLTHLIKMITSCKKDISKSGTKILSDNVLNKINGIKNSSLKIIQNNFKRQTTIIEETNEDIESETDITNKRDSDRKRNTNRYDIEAMEEEKTAKDSTNTNKPATIAETKAKDDSNSKKLESIPEHQI